ncbi:hypothetical protein [Parapedobacter defluvii]|uniref:hypothetical protein n=1 Tax=Parapedobacter defluvii TaxID=2045106 RepID=UPI00334261C2
MNPIDRFLHHFDPHPAWANALRTGLCATLLVAILLLWEDFPMIYGANRFVDTPLLALKQDFPAIVLGPFTQHLALVIYAASCIAVLMGYWRRTALALLLILHQLIFTGNTLFAYGFDYLAASALYYAFLIPANPVSSWHSPLLRVVQLHLCAVYAVGGINKAFGAGWWDGTALWKAVIQPGYPGISISIMEQLPGACWVLGGWLVVVIELTYPILIWRSAARKRFLWLIMSLHAAIGLLMGLYLFSALMIALNIAAFHYPYLPLAKQCIPSILPMVKPLRAQTLSSETPAETSEADTNTPQNA